MEARIKELVIEEKQLVDQINQINNLLRQTTTQLVSVQGGLIELRRMRERNNEGESDKSDE